MHCEWVRSDVDGCEWVRMGALGHRMYGGAWKQGRKRQKWTCRAYFSGYGRGNFPGHHVFASLAKSDVSGCRWVYIGADGCGWMHGHRGKQKQDRKSNKWVRKACICNMCTPRNKAGSVQGWSWWLEWIIRRNAGEGRGVGYGVNVYKWLGSKKTSSDTKQNENE